ncbi:MAG: hypothetical protein QOH09_3898 [Pseudonocardiales bacterium]|jgi:quinol monooxygenase YgiN|nr:hypothetical protein [Pseudonocardiales bacterium]
MTITVRGELHVSPETRDEFAKVARALAQIAANEAGTLRYNWYISEDPTVFVVIEEYVDPEAAIAHNENCVEFLDPGTARRTSDSTLWTVPKARRRGGAHTPQGATPTRPRDVRSDTRRHLVSQDRDVKFLTG